MGESMKIVAVDNGYADQKICFWDESNQIKEMVLPSRAQMGRIALALDEDESGVYEIEGDAWTVSHNCPNPETITSNKYSVSELNQALVNHSLIAAGFGGKEVTLLTGLPFDQYFVDGKKNDSLFESIKESMKREIVAAGNNQCAIISEHKIYPESTAAWVDFAVSNTGELLKQNENGIAIVDIGGNTTDVTKVGNAGGKSQILIDESGTRQIGVLKVREKAEDLLKKEFKVERISPNQMDVALRTNTIRLSGQDHDVKELMNQAKRQVTKQIINFVHEKISDASDLDYVIYVGGGAAVLEDLIKEYPNSEVPENAQFANARGMLKFATFMESQ